MQQHIDRHSQFCLHQACWGWNNIWVAEHCHLLSMPAQRIFCIAQFSWTDAWAEDDVHPFSCPWIWLMYLWALSLLCHHHLKLPLSHIQTYIFCMVWYLPFNLFHSGCQDNKGCTGASFHLGLLYTNQYPPWRFPPIASQEETCEGPCCDYCLQGCQLSHSNDP